MEGFTFFLYNVHAPPQAVFWRCEHWFVSSSPSTPKHTGTRETSHGVGGGGGAGGGGGRAKGRRATTVAGGGGYGGAGLRGARPKTSIASVSRTSYAGKCVCTAWGAACCHRRRRL